MPTSFPALEDLPITELEADSPLGIGKLGLFDYTVSVPNNGITFVAAIGGILQSWGPVWPQAAIDSANRRAASTLAHMGLISGDTFTFFRTSLKLTQAQVATQMNVPLLTEQAWEANTIPVPRIIWGILAEMVCQADQRYLPPELSVNPDFRPRLIRIFPNGVGTATAHIPVPPCDLEPGPLQCPTIIG